MDITDGGPAWDYLSSVSHEHLPQYEAKNLACFPLI